MPGVRPLHSAPPPSTVDDRLPMPTPQPTTSAQPYAGALIAAREREGGRPARPRAPARGQRLDALGGLRGLAALGVLMLHVWMFSHGDQHRPPKHFVDFVLGELRLGVQLFF